MSDGSGNGGGAFAYAWWTAALVIVVLKLAGAIDAPWLAVTAPFWGPVLAIPAIAVAVALATVLAGGGRRGRRP